MLPVVFSVLMTTVAQPSLVAHRGESADAPENTLAAFRLAWERDVPAIELDVHLSRDGRLVVCHDADTQRTTSVKKSIKQCDWAELQPLDAGSWKDKTFAGERLPLLEEALATIPDGHRCLIEVKVGAEAIPAIAKVVAASGKRPEQLAIISFQADAVAAAKKELPQLKAYFLSGFKQDKASGAWQPTAEQLIVKAKELGADGLDLSHAGPIDAAFVQKVRDAGLELHVWTIDDLPTARRYAALGVDSITTNRAGALHTELTTK